jgi:hypothetical protein
MTENSRARKPEARKSTTAERQNNLAGKNNLDNEQQAMERPEATDNSNNNQRNRRLPGNMEEECNRTIWRYRGYISPETVQQLQHGLAGLALSGA